MFDCDVTISTSHKAEGFVAFFKEKIDDIRGGYTTTASQSAALLAPFTPCTQHEVRRIVMTSTNQVLLARPGADFLAA